jgi:hypothetical protein
MPDTQYGYVASWQTCDGDWAADYYEKAEEALETLAEEVFWGVSRGRLSRPDGTPLMTWHGALTK